MDDGLWRGKDGASTNEKTGSLVDKRREGARAKDAIEERRGGGSGSSRKVRGACARE
jgi:hypothetical protein